MLIPLLFLSDGVTAQTGLARITCDLATRVHKFMPDVFRVGCLGYGGSYSRSIPFPQYQIDMKDWVVFNLPEVWHDFAGDERGIVFTIWDASRMLWFARPENCEYPMLQKFLKEPPFEKWGYFPVDAKGPNDRLTGVLGHIINGYDRAITYSQWAETTIRHTITPKEASDLELTQLPHGIDTSVFYPRNRILARHQFGERINARSKTGKFLSIPDDCWFIGIVGTNQTRKDFGLGVAAVSRVAQRRNVILWIHTDALERHWSLPALISDFGLLNKCVITTIPMTDEQMAWCLSACDVTLGIGAGEGFGLPIFESLACGTPCIHGDYGGAAEHLPKEYKMTPEMLRLEGAYNCYRPVFNPYDWAERIMETPKTGAESLLPDYLSWGALWPRWKKWFADGVGKTNGAEEENG